jgi:hypothetical protein
VGRRSVRFAAVGRRWVPILVVFVGLLLGLAVAGFPSRHRDAPLAVQTETSLPATASTLVVVTTTPATAPAPTPAAVRAPAEVRVTAVNASKVAGTAGRGGARLKSQGYAVQSPSPDRRPQDTSVVMYRPGFENEARALASNLELDGSAVAAMDASASKANVDLAVVIGNDLAGRLG